MGVIGSFFRGLSILRHLTNMSLLSTDVFRHLFFDSDEYARRCSIDIDHDQEADVQMEGIDPVDTRYRRNEHDTSHMAKTVRKKINSLLEDWFSFIEVKSQRNITMSLCVYCLLRSDSLLEEFLLVVMFLFLVLFILPSLIDHGD